MALTWGNVGPTTLIWNGTAPTPPSPPIITTGIIFSVAENVAFSTQLDADLPVTWAKSGGADAALFTLTADGLLGLAAQNYEAPADANTDNTYLVQVTATSADLLTASVNISVSVTNVTEGGGGNGFAQLALNAAAKTGFTYWTRLL